MLTIDYIQKEVADYFNIPVDSLQIKTRKREIVQARQIAMYFSKSLTISSLASIGAQIGQKDHATVLSACKTVNNLIDTDKLYRSDIEEIEKILLEAQEEIKSIPLTLKDIFMFGMGVIVKKEFKGERLTDKVYSIEVCCEIAIRYKHPLKSIGEYLLCSSSEMEEFLLNADFHKVIEMSNEIEKLTQNLN